MVTLDGGDEMVKNQVSSSEGHRPLAPIVLWTTYVPGVLAARFIKPVTGLIESPEGTEEKVPATALLINDGLGLASF